MHQIINPVLENELSSLNIQVEIMESDEPKYIPIKVHTPSQTYEFIYVQEESECSFYCALTQSNEVVVEKEWNINEMLFTQEQCIRYLFLIYQYVEM